MFTFLLVAVFLWNCILESLFSFVSDKSLIIEKWVPKVLLDKSMYRIDYSTQFIFHVHFKKYDF